MSAPVSCCGRQGLDGIMLVCVLHTYYNVTKGRTDKDDRRNSEAWGPKCSGCHGDGVSGRRGLGWVQRTLTPV